MAIKVNAQQMAEKWAERTKMATEQVRQGVANVSVNPMTKAIAKKDKLKANWLKAVDSGKWERKMKKISLEQWKSFMIDKGIGRIASGVDSAKDDYGQFAVELLAFESALVGRIDSMPDVTLDDSIQRAAAWIRGMAEFKRKDQ